jgi:cytosine deaminase
MTLPSPTPRPRRLVLRGGSLVDGTVADISIDEADGRIIEVGSVTAAEGDVIEDCTGRVVLPAGVEPHAHLDKALFDGGRPIPGDLATAISDWAQQVGDLSHESFVERATEIVEALVARGTTTIRTHVDVSYLHGLRGVHALVEVRDRMAERGLADIELVGLAGPLCGEHAPTVRRLLDEAVEAGIDVIGGSPDTNVDPVSSNEAVVDAAVRHGLTLDAHTDQFVAKDFFHLPQLVELVGRHGIEGAVASHAVSLASQDIETQRRTAAALAEAGMAVLTMPLTSLYLFGWDEAVSPPRGVTAINLLREEGVVVAAGGDNVRDAFFPFGRCDPFETANVLALVAHLDAATAWDMCSNAARTAMGRPVVEIRPGGRADLVAIEAADIGEAIASAGEDRIVVHRGRVVARSSVQRRLLA